MEYESMKSIALVCGEFHRNYVEEMVNYAKDEASSLGIEISDIEWVPGSYEAPLAASRLLTRGGVQGVVCLGVIEKGETDHGLVIGQAVSAALMDLQIKFGKPVGLGIIGPGAEEFHIGPRLEPHARSAIRAVYSMLD
jgi:6,7-dimethyl-8-ribityllumazine synthase